MFSIDELLSKQNQRLAFEHLLSKKDGCGSDKMLISQLEQYWEINYERIEQELRIGNYQPGIINSNLHKILRESFIDVSPCAC